VIQVVALVAGFVAMEGVSYAAHRWLMHGPGMVWHASHHAPPAGRFERNDLFPACFAVVGVALFALAAAGLLPGWIWWVAAGVTLYGAAYLVVHEVFIHGRVPLGTPGGRYVRWVRDAHRAHHVDGGEPYGMLLPLMTARGRRRVDAARHDESLLPRARGVSASRARSRR
jgi:beta-carotene 3-hydroxylase